VNAAPSPRPFLRLRGRSFVALVLSPEAPVAAWVAGLDAQLQRAPSFFAGRPVVLDLAALTPQEPDAASLVAAVRARGIHLIAVEGAGPTWPGAEYWPPPLIGGVAGRVVEVPDEMPAHTPAEPAALVLAQSIRSGQTILHAKGDVTIVGAVASGSEIMAGGSIHVYGALRGRAVAGIAGDPSARIFCRRLEAELLAINGFYRTADDMPAPLRGRPVQAWLEGGALNIAALE